MLTLNYVNFATRYNISVADAYVLPALFEGAARKCDMPLDTLLDNALRNRALGQYLADCARKVAAEDRAS